MLKKIFIIFSCLVIISGCSNYIKDTSKKNQKKQEYMEIQKHIKPCKVKVKNNPEVPSW